MQPVANGDAHPSRSVTRMLQHSILQLCNEHIGYNHTLQVLGVLCMTIDDRQQELVVKVNNTLKRVNPVTPPKDAPPPYPPPDWVHREAERCGSTAADVLPPPSTMYENGGGATAERRREPPHQRHNISSPSFDGCGASADARKVHGRKQTKPIRVKHVFDEADGDMSDGDVVTIEPTHPDNDDGGDGEPPPKTTSTLRSSPKRLGGIRNVKRKLSELFGPPTNGSLSEILTQGNNVEMSSSSKKTSNGTTPKSSSTPQFGDDSRDSDCSQRLVVIMPDDNENGNVEATEEERKEASATTENDGALNFSMCALNGGQHEKTEGGGGAGRSGGGMVGGGPLTVTCLTQDFPNGLQNGVVSSGGIRIKEEIQSFYPVDLNFLMNANSFDVSQNLAIHGSFLNDHQRFLPTAAAHLTPSLLGNGRLATIQGLLGNDLSSTSNSGLRYLCDGTTAGSLILDEAQLTNMVNGLSAAQAAGASSYTISNCLNDGLTMQLTRTRTPVKDRSSMKFKDIVAYNDSVPPRAPRGVGSRIEGDFMLDSLNVEGKKRRRRTGEDALTSEEIAEYMGSCDRTAVQACTFRCKYCGEVCADLSRYFSHTLVRHNSFICHQCGKNFTTKSSLLRHRPIHTGMRRFACSICRKSFYRKDKCKAHIKRHLGVGSEPAEKYPQIKVGSA